MNRLYASAPISKLTRSTLAVAAPARPLPGRRQHGASGTAEDSDRRRTSSISQADTGVHMRRRKVLALVATLVGLISGAVLVASPAQARFGDYRQVINSVTGKCADV